MSESLVQYGTSFQSKLIVSLMMDVKYTTTIIDILDVSYFDSDANKFLVKSIKDYFQIAVEFDTVDSMGANFINSCLEQIALTFETEFNESNIF